MPHPRPRTLTLSSRPALLEPLENRVLLSGTLEPASWIGNSYTGSGVNSFIQMDAKDLTVRPSDGTVVAVTWWDEGGREGGVYSGSDGHPVASLTDFHSKGCLAAIATEGYVYVGWQSSSGANIRRYSLTNYGPNTYNWDGQSTIFVSATGLVTGLAISGNTIYASDIKTDTVYAYDLSNRAFITSFVAPNPHKMVVAGGYLWVIQKNSDAYAAAGGKVVKYGLDGTPTGVEITDLVDPTAINVSTTTGELMIADSGGARNHIRYYNISGTPTLTGTFGQSISSGTPGQVADDKFDYISGMDMDTAGNLYVSTNGGGVRHDVWTDGTGLTLRKFNTSGQMVWQKIGQQFVDVADADPISTNDVYTLHEHYVMDYSQPAGQQATWTGYTVNRELYPQDPRLYLGHSYVVAVQQIQGAKVMFATDMYGDYFTGYRFEGETAIPFVMLHKKNEDGFPFNKPTGTNGWLWNDLDGQGDFDAGEYDTAGGFHWGLTTGWFVDSQGDLWQIRKDSNGLARYRCQGVNANGVPVYDFAHTEVTYLSSKLGTDPFTHLQHAEYDPDNDRMFLFGWTSTYNGSDVKSVGRVVRRYDNWSATPTFVSQSVMPVGTAVLGSVPAGAASACVEGRYVFSVACDATVTVFDSNTGSQVAQFGPSELGGSGVVDVIQGIRVSQRANGEFNIFVEEDWHAKVTMYTWTPDLPNSGVVAVNDSAGAYADTAISINVLANDTDADSDTLAINQVAQPAHGTVSISGGQALYTPAAGWTGTDSFTYIATDRKGTFSQGTVTVTVSPTSTETVVQALADAMVQGGVNAGTNYCTATSITLKNDSSADYDRQAFLKYDLSGVASVGSATLVITPLSGGTSVGSTTVRVRLLADTADGWSETGLTWNNMTAGTGSSVTFSGASLTYTQPFEIDVTSLVNQAMNANGVASFHLDVTSAANSQAFFAFASREHATQAYRPVLVINGQPQGNTAPVATDDSATVTENSSVNIAVLANDTDADSDPLSLSAVTQGAHGAVAINGSQVTYTPATNWFGTDSFTYTISDGQGGSDTATVAVTVTENANAALLYAAADAYVRGGTYASTNYGSDTTLVVKDDSNVDYDRQSFIKFDLMGLGDIEQATLKLHINSVQTSPAPVKLYAVTNDTWGESTITWSNKPAAGTLIQTLSLTGSGDITVDVTSFIQSQQADGAASFCLLQDGTAANNVSFSSRQGAYSPALDIALAGPTVTDLSATNDAYVRGGTYASTNYGSDTTLVVKDDSSADYDRQAYLKFDLTGLTSITSAILILTPVSLGTDMANMTIGVKLLDDAADGWAESSLTWANKPASTGSTVTFSGSSLTVGQAMEVDVTTLLQQAIHANDLASFHLLTTSAANSSRSATFASAQSGTVDYRPILRITA